MHRANVGGARSDASALSQGVLVEESVAHSLQGATPTCASSGHDNWETEPGDRVEVDEPIAQVETDKVTIDVACPEVGVIQKFVAEEGDTVTLGTKIAVISKSASSDMHVAPSEEKASKDAPQPSPPTKEKKKEKETLKAEAPIEQKPKASPPSHSKTSDSEPQLRPKGKKRKSHTAVFYCWKRVISKACCS